jgi:hypothetical protein
MNGQIKVWAQNVKKSIIFHFVAVDFVLKIDFKYWLNTIGKLCIYYAVAKLEPKSFKIDQGNNKMKV